MVPVDLSVEAAAPEDQEPSWWSGFKAPEVPDVNPQSILEYFMEVVISAYTLLIVGTSCMRYIYTGASCMR